jgi:hypothetical protein
MASSYSSEFAGKSDLSEHAGESFCTKACGCQEYNGGISSLSVPQLLAIFIFFFDKIYTIQ